MTRKVRHRKLRFYLVSAVGAGVLLSVLYAGKLLFTEDLYTSKGSFAYYVTIHSSTIKSFPQIRKVGDEEYYSSCGDGPKPRANGIRYLSDEEPAELLTTLDQFLLGKGFVRTESDSLGELRSYTSNGSSIDLLVRPADGLHRVTVTEYYR